MDIAVHRPLLPNATRLIPYLEEIDASRWYSNRGPLLRRFEQALGRHFKVDPGRVVVVANATAGLSLCLLGAGRRPGGLCIVPSWTYVASAVAVVRAGLTPWLHDVDETSWQLDPAGVADSIRREPGVAAVLVTAPFGARVDPAPWQELAERTGVAVVIDAAAGFDSLAGGPVDAVVSLHATKVLGIGEGGVVVARDAARADRIRDLASFGITADGEIRDAGMNAKLSDYGAAIGLAALDEWPLRRAAFQGVRDRYAARLGQAGPARPWLPEGVSSTFLVRLPGPMASGLGEALGRRGIATRRWWGGGCHRHPAFAAAPRRDLPVTEALADSVLGLPCYADLAFRDIDGIVAELLAALGPSAGRGV